MAKPDPVLVKIAKEHKRRQEAGLPLIGKDAPDDNLFEQISWLYKQITGYDINHQDLNEILEIMGKNKDEEDITDEY